MMSTSHTIVHASIVNTSFSNEDQFCTQLRDIQKLIELRLLLVCVVGFDLKLMGQFFYIIAEIFGGFFVLFIRN